MTTCQECNRGGKCACPTLLIRSSKGQFTRNDFIAFNTLTTGLLNDLGIFAGIFRCFHETKQTKNEVERFHLQLDRICFGILLRQSENICGFCKVLSQFAFRNMIVSFYTSSSARARSSFLPSPTQDFWRERFLQNPPPPPSCYRQIPLKRFWY